MKKLLSVLLVAVMVLGMAVVANAADAFYTADVAQTAPGEAILVPIIDDGGTPYPAGAEAVKGMRIDATYVKGADLVSKIELTTADINDDDAKECVVKITTKKFFTPVDGKDLEVKIRLVNNSTGEVAIADTTVACKVAFAVNELEAGAEGVTVSNNAPVIDFGKNNKVEKFTLSFAGGYFQVKVVNQGKLNLLHNMNANKEVLKANDGKDADFLTFEAAPEFDFTGTLYLNAGSNKYLYTVDSNNKLTKVDAEIKDGNFVVKTNKLGSYVMSAEELVSAAASSSSSASTNNPGTGSSDAIGVAVALAVVSLAAAGAVAFKKASK